MSTSNGNAKSKQRPEHKWGPFQGGTGLALWLNQLMTKHGVRYFRSLTIQSRRFRDPKTGEWRDAKSLRPTDLPALILAMEAAQRYMAATPLPGPEVEDDGDIETLADGEVPNDDAPGQSENSESRPAPASIHDSRDIPF